jgi:uncharacterized protein
MKILITGSSGFIGSALVTSLAAQGYDILKIVRRRSPLAPNEIFWDPDLNEIDSQSIEGVDIVIHLAGENIAKGLWTKAKKKRILESRTQGTRLLSETLARLTHPPKTFLSASAIGYYGERGDTILTEKSPKGEGFLSDVCEQWESSTQAALDAGIRVINFRIGIVLDPHGGALKTMLFPFKWGLGGKMGSGEQFMSWIALDDLTSAISFIIKNSSLQGALNVVGPNPIRNEQFTKELGHVLHRPTFLSVPSFALHGLLGDAAEEVLLASTRVMPEKLLDSGFVFKYTLLESYLKFALN